MNNDPLDSEFVKHVRKYRPASVTARLADEVESLRARVAELTALECDDSLNIVRFVSFRVSTYTS